MANIIQLPVETRLDLDADEVLENNKGRLAGFIYAGYDKEGKEVFGATFAKKKDILWLIEQFRQVLLEQN